MAGTGTFTAEDLWRLPPRNCREELIRGKLIAKPYCGALHGICCARLIAPLYNYGEDHRIGTFFAAGTGFVIERNADTVIAPDIAFVRSGQLYKSDINWYLTVPPDLAIEVVDWNETAGDLTQRMRLWLNTGTRLVWVVDPEKKNLTVYSPTRRPHTLRMDESVSGEDVLPGFNLPIAEIFR